MTEPNWLLNRTELGALRRKHFDRDIIDGYGNIHRVYRGDLYEEIGKAAVRKIIRNLHGMTLTRWRELLKEAEYARYERD